MTQIAGARDVPGAFAYFHNCSGLVFICPCGCRAIIPLPFYGFDNMPPVWKYDANIERPTLSPAIDIQNHWRGYLLNGEFITLAQPDQ